MSDFLTVDDVISLKRALTSAEAEKAKSLIPVVSAELRDRAKRVGRDLDAMIEAGDTSAEVVKSVCADIIMRELNASTTSEAATQVTQSAGGYSLSYAPFMPGGGLFIKRAELSRLGLKRQRVCSVELM